MKTKFIDVTCSMAKKVFLKNCYSEESKTIVVVEDYNKAASLRVFMFSLWHRRHS